MVYGEERVLWHLEVDEVCEEGVSAFFEGYEDTIGK